LHFNETRLHSQPGDRQTPLQADDVASCYYASWLSRYFFITQRRVEVSPEMSQSTANRAPSVPAFISDWVANLQSLSLRDLVPDPTRAAVISTDMVVGFCKSGALASERVGNLVEPVADLFRRSFEHGIRDFVLLQDTHDPETPEFGAWPVHCLRGSEESETVAELAELPFADEFTMIPKNSLAPGFGTTFEEWLSEHPNVTTAIAVGNCTDLCVYQLAMYLRVRANAFNLAAFDVIVPADCVDTYDLPVDVAADGAMPHPGEFFHEVFLYHLGLNGVRVVRSLT
jgi:nicotinamidase-related amidase